MKSQFIIRKSIWGEYYQVRVRDLNDGGEETIDRIDSLAEAQKLWDSLTSQGMKSIYPRPQ